MASSSVLINSRRSTSFRIGTNKPVKARFRLCLGTKKPVKARFRPWLEPFSVQPPLGSDADLHGLLLGLDELAALDQLEDRLHRLELDLIQDQIALFRYLISTSARRNPGLCGTNQGN